MEEYFKNSKESLEGPENILNYDETDLSDNPGRNKVIAKRGLKRPKLAEDRRPKLAEDQIDSFIYNQRKEKHFQGP
uniref:Uncharacterized protein n=1 Tax=Romanomermis culicivorax TaxID=13658 RepID=A0A915HJX8_ROMCU